MVKKLTAAPADVSDVTAKPDTAPPPEAVGAASPHTAIDDVLADLERHATTAQGDADRKEAKTEKLEVDTLRSDVLDTLKVIAKPARMAAWFLKPEDFEKLWGDAVQKEMAGPIADIMRRNGWDMKNVMSAYGPYAMLAIAVGPSAMVTFKVYGQAKKWQREEAKKAATDGNAGS